MEITNQILNNGTQLKDRFLVYDGDSILDPDNIEELILNGLSIKNIYTTYLSDDIIQYNKASIDKIEVKTNVSDFDFSWNIPEYYKNLNVLYYVIDKYLERYNINDDRYNRILYEMKRFKKHKLYDFLKTVIYIQEMFEKNEIVKGVGRGSSVASYVLYIIGIHKIDSYKYNLNFSEFIQEEVF